MSEHDRKGRKDVLEKGHSVRVGASVLLAAASLLGTSLGVSAATSDEPLSAGTEDSAGQKPTGMIRSAEKTGGYIPPDTTKSTSQSTKPPPPPPPPPPPQHSGK